MHGTLMPAPARRPLGRFAESKNARDSPMNDVQFLAAESRPWRRFRRCAIGQFPPTDENRSRAANHQFTEENRQDRHAARRDVAPGASRRCELTRRNSAQSQFCPAMAKTVLEKWGSSFGLSATPERGQAK